MRPGVFTWPAADTAAICALQTTAGAATLTIDGTLLDLPLTQYGVRHVLLPGIQRVVTLTSANNLSAVNVTIVGKDLRGAAVSETRAGPNANTVSTTAEYNEITSVSVNGAVTAMSVGTGNTGSTNWFTCSNFADPTNIAVALDQIGGTVSVTCQNTLDDVQTNTSPTTFALAAITTAAAAAQGSYSVPPRFIRAINASGSGSFTFTIIQAG